MKPVFIPTCISHRTLLLPSLPKPCFPPQAPPLNLKNYPHTYSSNPVQYISSDQQPTCLSSRTGNTVTKNSFSPATMSYPTETQPQEADPTANFANFVLRYMQTTQPISPSYATFCSSSITIHAVSVSTHKSVPVRENKWTQT